jgi:hypothetical protein
MPAELTRAQAIDALENGWGTYVRRVQALAPPARTEFLRRQGYARLADLLGHVIAWWTKGQSRIREYLIRPDLPPDEYDVDDFNARAVATYRSASEEEVIRLFEEMRAAWVELVRSLPADAFRNEKIRARLQIELVGHLEEHEL